ncbi:TIGR03986 family CRISPR-associated RAMP protein [Sulfurivermis fontis]|uniref:TIGR03986 family type III CRISPR-associated RAMP protein n=1 Tax=Sulfurivermis fontis TaxID=1972068 RepID=UPI000FDB42E5|nr:TIGR03986 family CRISPR-associated RAMP protein [Sulfurivermis fontis]
MHQQARNNPSKQNPGQQNKNDKPRGGATMQAISAPYNFVPLAETVVIPEWGHLVSHDIPFRDGLCGSIEFTLTAHTPIMIGGRRKKQGDSTAVDVFQTPDGQYAIPGSSLKGMIRNVLEIATFSRFRQVDDRRLSIRDLTSGIAAKYVKALTREESPKHYAPKSKAGWLQFTKGRWSLTPCDHAHVDHDLLADFSGLSKWHEMPSCPAANKYKDWGKRPITLRFTADDETWVDHSDGKKLFYRKVTRLNDGPLQGTLVFTGQPMPRKKGGKSAKHMEFIFFNKGTPTAVPDKVMSEFLAIHQESTEWKDWAKKQPVPVFYLEDEAGDIKAIGLTQMFRLPYKNSIHDMIGHSSPDHLAADAPDFADLLFGRIDEQDGKTSLKGRVQFELAREVTGAKPEGNGVKIVLAEPKPSYYPNYICQKTTKDGTRLEGTTYNSYFDDDALLRGWKRYPARPATARDDSNSTDNVSSIIRPLPAGSRFEGRVVFHNLKPQELGALLWSMTWGGADHLRHGLGMGKPYGYGQVSIALGSTDLHPNDPAAAKPDQDALVQTFKDWMKRKLNTPWENTPQVLALLAMADPAKAAQVKGGLRYMRLSSTSRINEFADAKSKNNGLLVLANYPGTPKTDCTKRQPKVVPAAAVAKTITTGREIWSNVTVAWTPGDRQLSARKDGVTAIAKNDKELIATLPEAARKKLDKHKRLALNVTVTRTGNAATIEAISTTTEQP